MRREGWTLRCAQAMLLPLRHGGDFRANDPGRLDYLGYFGGDRRTAGRVRGDR
jgi:hypothetical protein